MRGCEPSEKFYDGPRPDDPKPIGGGANNRTNFGHEGFNFRRYGERLLGFVKAGADEGKLDLQRINPSPMTLHRVRGVTLIFVATDPKARGQKIVGWYRNATVYSESMEFDSSIVQQMISEVKLQFPRFKPSGYRAEASAADAVLLPLAQRRLQRVEIPKRNGIGQANVCYPFDGRGFINSEKLKWIRDALEYIDSYSGPNYLLRDNAVEEEIEEAVTTSRERSHGFQSNPEVRRAVEEFAMQCAREYLLGRKYTGITRTDDRHCYDYTCKHNGKMVFVEVKGTQTRGEKIIVTKNEKAHLETSADTILYVRHSIDVKRGKPFGGMEIVLDRWDAQSGVFAPAAYIYTLPAVTGQSRPIPDQRFKVKSRSARA
ncbi:MAG: hypothetical protein DMG96_28340 [Acidobacteria bacterium]|nr:MAG: hypothetical protein DMG96_28340 [Acidobacteriota bacterium]